MACIKLDACICFPVVCAIQIHTSTCVHAVTGTSIRIPNVFLLKAKCMQYRYQLAIPLLHSWACLWPHLQWRSPGHPHLSQASSEPGLQHWLTPWSLCLRKQYNNPVTEYTGVHLMLMPLFYLLCKTVSLKPSSSEVTTLTPSETFTESPSGTFFF